MSISEPGKIPVPFADSGLKNTIPAASDNTTGKAGFDKGFPERTMLPKASGGIPPSGMDFNGILYDITSAVRYMQAGGRPTYDAAFASAIGGYPAGAVLISNDGSSVFQNTVAGNVDDPNSGGAGWERPDLQVMELYRRSYAEAGYNVVGTFQAGFAIVNVNDIGVDLSTGKGYTGPAGTVAAGTDPTAGGFFDVSGQSLRRQMGYLDAWGCVSGVLNDTVLQNAIDNCNHIRLPKGNWLYKKIKLRDGLIIEGDDNVNCWLKQVQPTDTSTGGFYKAPGNLSDVQFVGFAYDGQRKASPTSPFNHMCYIELNGSEVVENILAYRLNMKNAQEDFINVTSYSNTARGKNIKAKLCRFSTDADKVSLPGNAVISSSNGLRCWNRADPNTSYGIDVFTDVGTFGCEGERIRSVSDFKRGCKTFSIRDNNTVNCHDCHHSFDGAFDGVVMGNIGRNEPGFSLGNRPNMIEGQGGATLVQGNEFDGGGVTLSCINITDYGMPGEGNGTTIINVGHRSSGISVIGNKGKNVTQNMFNGINNLDCQWLINSAENATSHGFAQSSGTARNDATTGLPLVASGNKYAINSEKNVGLPISIRNTFGTVLGSNTDEYGNESLYLGGGDTLLVLASEYAPFRQTARTDNFNPNPQLKLDAAGTGIADWICPRPVVTAATKPAGTTNAVTINDDSTTANLEHVINGFYPAIQNEVAFISLYIKRNTATSCGVLVQEYDAAGAFITSYFKNLSSTPVNWTKYITRHKAVAANCASLKIGVLPAANFNNPPAVGMTDIALVYVGRAPA